MKKEKIPSKYCKTCSYCTGKRYCKMSILMVRKEYCKYHSDYYKKGWVDCDDL